ncbi:ankyrin repeat domain-containing protein [Zhouia sp. PK063]|uniref:ankyrin repeat domain-containing protein n=1 Tax=Zhouia sp. PK063 TaxID=3373602 RepID=UPI0037901CF1
MKKLVVVSALFVGILTVKANTVVSQHESTTYEMVASPKVSPFCMAIVKGDFETVQKLIEMGADVNVKSNGLTPAMYAARYNRCKILSLLIKEGADLKTKDSKHGYTAMRFAELSNAKDAQKVLKEALNS